MIEHSQSTNVKPPSLGSTPRPNMPGSLMLWRRNESEIWLLIFHYGSSIHWSMTLQSLMFQDTGIMWRIWLQAHVGPRNPPKWCYERPRSDSILHRGQVATEAGIKQWERPKQSLWYSSFSDNAAAAAHADHYFFHSPILVLLLCGRWIVDGSHHQLHSSWHWHPQLGMIVILI